MQWLFALIVSVWTWSQPQPQYSKGLVGLYGDAALVRANAEWRGYDLSLVPAECGFSAISPEHLGQLAYITVGAVTVGPCLSVDAVARPDAYASIYRRHEIAEVSRATAEALGFEWGAQGTVWFGRCGPPPDATPQEYRPPLSWDTGEIDHTPSYFPYSPQQKIVVDCNRKLTPAGHTESE